MSEVYKGFTLNQPGDPAPWGTVENTLFKAIIDDLGWERDEVNGYTYLKNITDIVGVGTVTPLQNVGSATGDFTGIGLHIKSVSELPASLIIEGDDSLARIIMADRTPTEKLLGISFGAQVFKIRRLSDDGSDNGLPYFVGQSGITAIGLESVVTGVNLAVGGKIQVNDKLIFTQVDQNEFIDSLADGFMDYGATTGHRFNTDITLANGAGLNLQEDITFTGGTAENKIIIPDNLAVALDITEAANSYQKFITTNTSEAIVFGFDVGLGTDTPGIMAGGADVSSNTVFQVADGVNSAWVVINGNAGAHLELQDSAASANFKRFNINHDAGLVKFRRITDIGGLGEDIMTLTASGGAVGFGIATPDEPFCINNLDNSSFLKIQEVESDPTVTTATARIKVSFEDGGGTQTGYIRIFDLS